LAFHLFHILIKIYPICMIKIGLKEIFANHFQIYLLPTFIILKKIQILYSIYHRPNEIDVFKMKHNFSSNLHFCVYVKNYHIFKWDFR
jgi:hypothetical protein